MGWNGEEYLIFFRIKKLFPFELTRLIRFQERRDWKRGDRVVSGELERRNIKCSNINFYALKFLNLLFKTCDKLRLRNWSISLSLSLSRTRHQPSRWDINGEMNPCFTYRFNLFIVKKAPFRCLMLLEIEEARRERFQFISLLYRVRRSSRRSLEIGRHFEVRWTFSS